MIIALLLFIFVILIILPTFLTLSSTLHIKIENLKISNINKLQDDSNKYKLEISFYLFNKIKWGWKKFNNDNLKKIYQNAKLDKIDLRSIEKEIKWSDLKQIKKIEPKFALFNLNVKVGTEDVIVTSFLVFAISTFLSILLPYTIKEYKKDKYVYEIKPIYMNQNLYEIRFNCIFEIKMVHIINIVYVLLKKRRVDNNEQRASNRKSNGYSYE